MDQGSEWSRAIKLYNDTLTKDPKKKILTNPEGIYSMFDQQVPSIDELIDYTREAKKQAEAARWRISSRIEDMLKWFDRYAPVIDVMVQQQPRITGLLWGSIRVSLSVAISEIAISENITSNIIEVMAQIGRWEEYLQLYPASSRLSSIVVELFAQLINVCVRATIFYNQTPAARYIKSVSASFKEKKDRTLQSIKNLSETAEREVELASRKDYHLHAKLNDKEREEQTDFRKVQAIAMRNIDQKCESFTRTTERILKVQELSIPAIVAYLEENAQHKLFSQKRAEAADWLWTDSHMSPYLISWEKNTCQWVEDQDDFREWKSTGCCGPLWIHGIPGCGKSVMASYLVQNCFDKDEVPLGVFAYFFKKSQDSSTPSNMVCSTLAKIISHPSFDGTSGLYNALNTIGSYMDCYKSGSECPLQTTWSILENLLKTSQPFAIIMDGIDECNSSNDVQTLLQNLSSLAKVPHARIIVTSRYRTEFLTALENPIRVPMAASRIDAEIQTMIRGEIGRTQKLARIGDQLLAKCASDANGMFLWARLVVDSMKEAPSMGVQLQRLRAFPAGLDAVYHQFLEQKAQDLDTVQLRLRRQLFSLIVGSHEFLTLGEIEDALALDVRRLIHDENRRILDIESVITQLCGPLVVVTDGVVTPSHASVKDYLMMNHTVKDTSTCFMNLNPSIVNQFIVDRCLGMLMLPKFGEINNVSAILRKSVGLNEGQDFENQFLEQEDALVSATHEFYRYAALHWHLHLTALTEPSRACLELLAKFFQSKQLVTWSETLFILQRGSHGSPAMNVVGYLKSWLALQQPSTREVIKVHHFIETSYAGLAREFEDSKSHPLEFAFINGRFGEYFRWMGKVNDQWLQCLVIAAEGIRDQLGPAHRLTINASHSLANATNARGFHSAAAKSFGEIRVLRSETLGPRHRDVYLTMSYECLCHFYLGDFEKAQELGEEAAKGLLATGLPTMAGTAHNNLYLGHALEGQNKVKEAMKLYEAAYTLWVKLHGPNDAFTLMVQSALASTYRKLGRLADAERHYTICFAARQRAIGLDHYVCVDIAISLSYVYYDLGRDDEAIALLELISPLETLTLPENFERVCQIKHLYALIRYKEERAEAEHVLSEILNESKTRWPPSNRELIWIRLTLARWLHARREIEHAHSLFQNVTRLRQDSPLINPPENRAEIEEAAIKLMKSAHTKEAKELLRGHGLEWARNEDFEISLGGPLTDTAWEKAYLEESRG